MKLSTGKTRNAQVTLTLSAAEAEWLLSLAIRQNEKDMGMAAAGGLYRKSLVRMDSELCEALSGVQNIGT